MIDILLEPDRYLFDGKLEMDPDCTIGYVSQFPELDHTKETTVFEYIGEKFIKIQNEIQSICTEMETSADIEPLLFIDFENLNALKRLINSHKGMLLVVMHNRYLLNHCFNKIIHLENMEIQEFDGRYIEYNFSLLQTKIELQELAAAEQEELERNVNTINNLRAVAGSNLRIK